MTNLKEVKFIYGTDEKDPLIKKLKITASVIATGAYILVSSGRSGKRKRLIDYVGSDFLTVTVFVILIIIGLILFYCFLIYTSFKKVGMIAFSELEIVIQDEQKQTRKTYSKNEITGIVITPYKSTTSLYETFHLFEVGINTIQRCERCICQTNSKGSIDVIKNFVKCYSKVGVISN